MALTIPQAAVEAQVCEETIRRKCSSGEIPARKVGAVWRIPRARFLRWLEGPST